MKNSDTGRAPVTMIYMRSGTHSKLIVLGSDGPEQPRPRQQKLTESEWRRCYRGVMGEAPEPSGMMTATTNTKGGIHDNQ